MHPEAKPPEEVPHLKDQAPEQAAAALAEIEARRRQIAPEFARLRWSWHQLAIFILVFSIARDIAVKNSFNHVILVALAIVLLVATLVQSRKAEKRLSFATPRSVKRLVSIAGAFVMLPFFVTQFFCLLLWHWAYWTPPAILTAAVLAITGPPIRRKITAMVLRGQS